MSKSNKINNKQPLDSLAAAPKNMASKETQIQENTTKTQNSRTNYPLSKIATTFSSKQAKASASQRKGKHFSKNAIKNFKSMLQAQQTQKPQQQKLPDEMPSTSSKAPQQQKQSGGNHIVINPAAMKIKSRHGGPFSRQAKKLQRVVMLEMKKEKSKIIREKTKNIIPAETINLDSSDEEEKVASENDDDDVIILPAPPVPLVTIDDSDDEATNEVTEVEMPLATNAKSVETNQRLPVFSEDAIVDADDLNVSSASESSFAKPQEPVTRRHDVSSRCNSPSNSNMSVDSFIAQSEHRTARAANSQNRADNDDDDDEDLNMLNTDTDSFMEQPTTTAKLLSTNADVPSNKEGNNFRVLETLFRAIDVYESESDMTDSVYSKGNANKPTIINDLDSCSSDSVQELNANAPPRTKRLRKRLSTSKGESDGNVLDCNSSSAAEAEDDDDDERVKATGVPYISQGPAVERHKRKRTSLPVTRRVSVSLDADVVINHVSDSELVNAQTTLANDNINQEEPDDDDDEVEEVETPSARSIAAKVLNVTAPATATAKSTLGNATPPSQSVNAVGQLNSSLDSALPTAALSDLGPVFRVIDKIHSKFAREKNTRQERDNTPIPITDEYISRVNRSYQNVLPEAPSEEPGQPKYYISSVQNKSLFDGIGWSEEMRRFYNHSWNGEDFNVSRIRRTMDPNPQKWKLNAREFLPIRDRRFKDKCRNCSEYGHKRSQCKRPKRPIVCFMCGENGHSEPRCPNTICLKCGNKTDSYVRYCNSCTFHNKLLCVICKVRGHTFTNCPDKWRRYHSTTKPNTIPDCVVHYKRPICCGCGKRGHLFEHCRQLNFLQYPIVVSTIKSHQKVWMDQNISHLQLHISSRLLYDPKEQFRFNIAKKVNPKSCYYRFLKAVGLEALLRRKRKANVNSSKTVAITDGDKGEDGDGSKSAKEPRLESTTNSQENRAENVMTVNADRDLENTDELIIIDEIGFVDSFSDNELSEENDEEQEQTQVQELNPTELLQEGDILDHNDKEVAPVDTQNEDDVVERQPHPCENLGDFLTLSTSSEKLAIYELTDSEDEAETSMIVGIDGDGLEKNPGISKNIIDKAKKTKKSTSVLVPHSDDSDDLNDPIVPSENFTSKILLSALHMSFLNTDEGKDFIESHAQEYNVKTKIIATGRWHELEIFGLDAKQKSFRDVMERKLRSLTPDQIQNQWAGLVPRRREALIRVLRENIKQLMGNLGNVKVLLTTMQHHERQQSKTGWKKADKIRRTLNMILVGRGGLMDGRKYLDRLLINLKELLCSSDDEAPTYLRHQIEHDFKMIFTSYRHGDYTHLVQQYHKLAANNDLVEMNFDPRLLNERVIDTTFNKQQLERLMQPLPSSRPATSTAAIKNEKVLVPNPLHFIENQSENGNQPITEILLNVINEGNQPSVGNQRKKSNPQPPPMISNIRKPSPPPPISTEEKVRPSLALKRKLTGQEKTTPQPQKRLSTGEDIPTPQPQKGKSTGLGKPPQQQQKMQPRQGPPMGRRPSMGQGPSTVQVSSTGQDPPVGQGPPMGQRRQRRNRFIRGKVIRQRQATGNERPPQHYPSAEQGMLRTHELSFEQGRPPRQRFFRGQGRPMGPQRPFVGNERPPPAPGMHINAIMNTRGRNNNNRLNRHNNWSVNSIYYLQKSTNLATASDDCLAELDSLLRKCSEGTMKRREYLRSRKICNFLTRKYQ